jgi:hypothetical protein
MRRLLPVLVLLLAGCVERRIYIRSEPPGADVFIDGEYVGRTRPDNDPDGPLSVRFAHYGTREWTLRKPGYQARSGVVELERPWYEYPVLDFFSEVLAPFPIRDSHFVEVKLEPARPADIEGLYRRAREYREGAGPEIPERVDAFIATLFE